MRTILNIALLLIAFAVGHAVAVDVTGQQAQLLMSVVKGTTTSGEVQLTINEKVITFTVTRDAVGNITARPVPSADAAAVGIAQISIGCTVAKSGALVPSTVVVINNDQSVVSYNVVASGKEGEIASLDRVGGGRVTTVVNYTKAEKTELTVTNTVGGSGGGTFTIRLPAGTLPGQYASTSVP